ncbi:MAG: single-stranded DNA-binding protein [Chloroflexota bacterium]|jgi:single-strand DNA-binding protein|nr:single-stranded DNA-binding protein [Chloroflexota bacterium]
MASFSKIIIVGNVGRDPELKMTPNGRPVCEFSVAVNRVSGRAEERVEQTDWYRVSCWSNLAERAQQMITKGRLVLVEGRFTPRTYTDREGKERLSLDISANDFQMLDPRPGREGGMTAPVGGDRAADGEKSAPGFDPDEIPF